MAGKRKQHRPMEFILDSSVTMAWYFKDEANPYANAVRKSLSKARALAPVLWPFEVANILVQGERRGRSTLAEATKWLDYLHLLPIRVDQQSLVRAWTEVMHTARTYHLSAYDASYLELAIRMALPLAALDDPLKSAASLAGVEEYQP
jgi:predicted nucleic acid-binding protein